MWSEIKSKIVNPNSKIEVRLPTEAEWEWTAGGPDHRRYAWGNKFSAERANTLEGRVLGTTPVGAYPGGAAQCRALDMTGNVREWSHTLYQAYPYRREDGREEPLAAGYRVVRGGSWFAGGRGVRTSSRYDLHPVGFNDIGGFRCVVAPVLPPS